MIEFSDHTSRLDFETVHEWLASSYWSPGIERDLVERAIGGSHCLGAYDDGRQVAFARMITDHATFAWLADVWVDERVRGQGIGRRMVRWFLDHPDFAGIRRIALTTADAHGVYSELGFTALVRPARYMERIAPDLRAMLDAAS